MSFKVTLVILVLLILTSWLFEAELELKYKKYSANFKLLPEDKKGPYSQLNKIREEMIKTEADIAELQARAHTANVWDLTEIKILFEEKKQELENLKKQYLNIRSKNPIKQ